LAVKKVLHLIHSDEVRGAEVFATQLARNLSDDSFESALCMLHPSKDGALKCDGIQTIRLRSGLVRGSIPGVADVFRVWELNRLIKVYKPDVLLAHGSSTLKYASLSKPIFNKTVTIYRNIGLASFWVTNPYKRIMNRLLARRFDAVVSLSRVTQKDFINTYGIGQEKVSVIFNGVDVYPFRRLSRSDVRAEYRAKLGIGARTVGLITVGSMSSEKNQVELISLAKRLRDSNLQVKLIIVGDGPLRCSLEEMAGSLGLSDHVSFLGVRLDVPALLAASDIFLLPSRSESLPAVLIEAGLAGKASVAYDVGAISDVISDNLTGLIISELDVSGFEKGVVKLIRDSQLRCDMGARAKTYCEELFDLEKIAGKYEQLFLELIEARDRRSDGEAA